MQQEIFSKHNNDVNGNPAGGKTESTGLTIEWQNGPLVGPEGRRAPSGCFVETVIASAIDRLEYYQSSKFACRENALAITKLQEALHWCHHRTQSREKRGVEGTHEA